MSQRHVTTGFVDRLRRTEERLRVLEGSKSTAVKQNDIRLSDTLVRADSPNNRLCLENLVTKQIICIGEQVDTSTPPQAVWSFSGDIASANVGDISPAYVMDRDATARRIVVAQQCGESFGGGEGSLLLCVSFCDTAGVAVLMTLNGSDEMTSTEINIPMVEDDRITVEVIQTTTPRPHDISVFVRFGTPTVGETTGNGCAA